MNTIAAEADLAAMNTHLDHEPADWPARAVLADFLEDLGRENEARFHRWLYENRKAPVLYSHVFLSGVGDSHRRWYWGVWGKDPGKGRTCPEENPADIPPHCWLGANHSLVCAPGNDGYIGRRTRTECEELLRNYLENAAYELPHPLPTTESSC